MIRLISGVFAAFSVTLLGCGKPEAPVVQGISNEGQQPAKAGTPDAAWQKYEGKDEGLGFSILLPPTWQWEKDVKMAKKVISIDHSIFLAVKINKWPSIYQRESFLKDTLQGLARRFSDPQYWRIQDQLVIKVGDLDAAWIAAISHPKDQPAPIKVTTHCVMRPPDYTVEIECDYTDGRSRRTAKDFNDQLAEFHIISKSFRVAAAQPAK